MKPATKAAPAAKPAPAATPAAKPAPKPAAKPAGKSAKKTAADKPIVVGDTVTIPSGATGKLVGIEGEGSSAFGIVKIDDKFEVVLLKTLTRA